MRDYLYSITRLFFFWLIIFFLNRLLFIIFFHSKFSEVPLTETLSTFIHGIPLDVSAACYLTVIPLLLLMIQLFVRFRFYRIFLFTYIVAVLIVTSFLSVFELAIYTDWGTKLSYRAIQYLEFAGDGAAFTKLSDDLLLLFLMLIQVAAGIYLIRRFFLTESFLFPWKRAALPFWALLHLALFSLLVLGIRGGWQQIPINESSAYFSSNQVVNDASVNTLWNAGKKMASGRSSLERNPYQFMSAGEASTVVDRLYHPVKDSTTSILTTRRPNIVLFVLESFTADVIGALNGERDVTPNLGTLIRDGLLFTNIYSQGFRTDQGLADLLSGFPAQPNFSIMMQPEKFPQLPFLPQVLSEAGYHCSFYYGGELGFANMKAYLLHAGISDLTGKESFSADQMNAKWGAHDGFVFQRQAEEIESKKSPFFSMILSLSSHEPFEVPMATRFPGKDLPAQFKNACAYTDQCLGEYFHSIRQRSWYSNTLFIIVADHGHSLPRNRSWREPTRFHIPVIFYGDVLKPEWRGVKIPNLGMQTDIPATLLQQLQLRADSFRWSNNLLNPYRNNFSYYTSDDGFGWITENGNFIYDFKSNKLEHSTLSSPEEAQGFAFLQSLFETYLAY